MDRPRSAARRAGKAPVRKSNRAVTMESLASDFATITGIAPEYDEAFQAVLAQAVLYLAGRTLRPLEIRRREFLGHVNWKFRVNADVLGAFYAGAANRGITFHYHYKKAIQRAFDVADRALLEEVLNEKGVSAGDAAVLMKQFDPTPAERTVAILREECEAPTKLRREVGERNIRREILSALFAAFVWVSLPEREMHQHFDPEFSSNEYHASFWHQLHARSPTLFNRENALHVRRVAARMIASKGLSEVRAELCAAIRDHYTQINNYGFFAVLIEHAEIDGRAVEWELAADIALFAEKHRQFVLDKAYFRWKDVRSETMAHVPGVDPSIAQFELVNEGFTYRDCFVLAKDGQVQGLLMILQKNERDETLIPCPACRSQDVQGNSYPSLGVRSWECNNLLCPDRSKYNRGKRYSFKGLAMQQAIEDPLNEIPVASVRRWSRDVVDDVSDPEIVDMLLRHYSMNGDVVKVTGWPQFSKADLGRRVVHLKTPAGSEEDAFWSGPFFSRYIHRAKKAKACGEVLRQGNLTVHVGDSGEVLRTLRAGSVDGAVTSPPYYNAREYSQWPNMYCHLHDMFDIAAEVFRVLKPGAPYLYNVFDYFDNERTVVFSAMGQKRVLLSAYTVDVFRRAGFELTGCVVWDKGEIEGKRGFNAGNFSPYYQAPFNCWEHVLAFRKPGRDSKAAPPSEVIRQKPVIKMVRGENKHGHSAPFPDRIPELLAALVPSGSVVLDPFAGSLTTGRVALRRGLRAICIERSREYCELGLRMLQDEAVVPPRQLGLFAEGYIEESRSIS
ncbi:MAG: site-specific DNA-methyltransferase [Myxococcales bacterium]|nr:site-specific DNA-methyltransferase [Myxococcales bacterium]